MSLYVRVDRRSADAFMLGVFPMSMFSSEAGGLLLLQDRKMTVLANRKSKLFFDKEVQMVISKHFDQKIRRSMVCRLFFYSIFVASLTWLGMLMTTRDTTSSFMFNEGVLAKVELCVHSFCLSFGQHTHSDLVSLGLRCSVELQFFLRLHKDAFSSGHQEF